MNINSIVWKNKVLKTWDFFKIFEFNFSYSKKTKLRSIEKKIETKGFPNKNTAKNNNDNIVVLQKELADSEKIREEQESFISMSTG